MIDEMKDEFYRKWRDGFSSVLDSVIEADDLTDAQRSFALKQDGRWFRCPCGSTEHLAYRQYIREGMSKSLSPVIVCFSTNQQWFVRSPEVASTILGEEMSYIHLLNKSPSIVRKVIRKKGWSKETKAFLMDTYGIDPEISQAIVDGTWDRKEKS